MAEVPIQISGVLYDKTARTEQSVVLMGKASIIGLSVGGGPIIPPDTGDGGKPPGTWGGAGEPMPTPPIHIPPTTLPDLPTGIWGPNDPRPTPPIYLPEPKPPSGSLIDWKAVWSPDTGWIVVGTPNVPHPAPSKK